MRSRYFLSHHAESKITEHDGGLLHTTTTTPPLKPTDKQLASFFVEFKKRCQNVDASYILQHIVSVEMHQSPRSVAADIVNYLQTAAFEAVGFDGRCGVLFVFDGLGKHCTTPELLRQRDEHFVLLSKLMAIVEKSVHTFAKTWRKHDRERRMMNTASKAMVEDDDDEEEEEESSSGGILPLDAEEEEEGEEEDDEEDEEEDEDDVVEMMDMACSR